MFRFVIFSAALSLSCFAAIPQNEENCPDGKQHYRAAVRHIESGGIGYEDGYTTLEAFLAPDPSLWKVTPFLDGRGHIFDNGKWAANAGVGLRALWGNRVYGINTYYDYRNTKRLTANQIGAGLETLGELFDFRLNGYLPVGAKISDPYDGVFNGFSGHYMILNQKIQSAMKGANAEFGFHLGKSEIFDFYAAAGPYYFIGEKAPATWGGKARISGIFKDFLSLEISDSYDRTFHNKFQGEISLTLSLGPKSKVKEQGRTCKVANTLNDRMLQPVDRQEIIVIDNAREKGVAIDPATGLPYFFVFVNNTSSSNGTYESPYPTLLLAQNNSSPNDIIYVFPGDGTTFGMRQGISLQANQKFWGSGVSHSLQTTVGAVSIPAQSSTSPTITNNDPDTDGNAIDLATNNAISGFTISDARNDAIFGTDSQSLDVSSCTFENTTTFTIEASFSGDASISVTDNQFLNNHNGISLSLDGTSTVVCSNNTFIGQTSESENPIEIAAASHSIVAQIENNILTDNTGGGIKFALGDVVNADISVLGNTFTNNGIGASNPQFSSSLAILISAGRTVDQGSIAFSGNTSSVNQSNSVYLHTDGAFTTLEAVVSDNTISTNHRAFVNLATPVADTLTLHVTGNSINGCIGGGILLNDTMTSTTTGIVTINGNNITNIGDMSQKQSVINIAQGYANLDLTVLDNEMDGCFGSGVVCFANSSEFTNMTANITGNTISNCQNADGNGASGISLDTYVTLNSTIENNTFTDDVTPSVGVGVFSPGTPVCLTFTGNSSNVDPSYSLNNPTGGVFNLSPCNVNAVNTGMIDTPGDAVTPVQSCPDGAICP